MTGLRAPHERHRSGRSRQQAILCGCLAIRLGTAEASLAHMISLTNSTMCIAAEPVRSSSSVAPGLSTVVVVNTARAEWMWWSGKAAAFASDARQTGDDELLQMATRQNKPGSVGHVSDENMPPATPAQDAAKRAARLKRAKAAHND